MSGVQPLGVALPEVEHLDVGLVHGLDVAGLGVDAERDGAVDAGDFDAVTWLDGDQVVSDVQGDSAWRLASWHLASSAPGDVDSATGDGGVPSCRVWSPWIVVGRQRVVRWC